MTAARIASTTTEHLLKSFCTKAAQNFKKNIPW